MTATSEILTEQYVQDAFHSYLKSSLTQAKAERLLDADMLSSAESDLMITGPALCLYFAALRCTTEPPSVPLPRVSKSTTPQELSLENCPEPFTAFLRVWSACVPQIQNLPPEHQHDLARIICNLPAIANTAESSLGGIAADMRAVAIEISQRRSFQERYGEDLQVAIDSGPAPATPGAKKKANFVPPPLYDPSPTSSAASSPRREPTNLPPSSPHPGTDHLPSSLRPGRTSLATPPPTPPHHLAPQYPPVPQSPSHLSPYPSPSPQSSSFNHHPSTSTSTSTSNQPTSPSSSRSSDRSRSRSRSASPSILTEDSPAIELIRETLYASLYDVLTTQPSLRRLLTSDPPRAYFASVALAILQVSSSNITPDGAVQGVLGQKVTLEECPPPLRPFLMELGAIGRMAREVEEEDTSVAMGLAERGKDVPVPRMERVREMLERGVGLDGGRGRGREGRSGERERSVEGRAVGFANRINTLALGISKLKPFRERQAEVFKVLAGMGE